MNGLEELLAWSRQHELELADRKAVHRREYEQLREVEKLEYKLAVARARFGELQPAGA